MESPVLRVIPSAQRPCTDAAVRVAAPPIDPNLSALVDVRAADGRSFADAFQRVKSHLAIGQFSGFASSSHLVRLLARGTD